MSKRTEYEHSFKVKDLKPFILYALENKYELVEENNQKRVLYKKEDKTMARITTKNNKILLDFKDDNLGENVVERRETPAIEINDYEAIINILDYLNYEKSKTLIRRRSVYKKENVIFEIDEYESPEKMFVVAIEGDKNEVDLVYLEVKNKYSKYFI